MSAPDARSVQEADQLLVNGDYIGDIIRRTYRREAIDCPAGCHVASSGFPLPIEGRFSGGLTINGYPIRRPYVLLTNRHYPQRRFDLAIKAMAEVRKRHPRVQLVIPRPATSHTESLKELVVSRAYRTRSSSLARLPKKSCRSFMRGLRSTCTRRPRKTSVWESSSRWPKAYRWWRGTRRDRLLLSGPGTGHLAEPLVVSDYAAVISGLLDNPAANQLTGERALEWARRFDWERHVDVLEKALLEVARTHERIAVEAATA
jgi:glycosyltransferase involved in cell wall biosynthesis